MRSFKAIFAYLSYTVAVTGLLLYLLFPVPAVKAYLNSRLAAVDPKLSLSTDRLSAALFPPGLQIEDAPLQRDGTKLVQIDQARVSPDWLSLFRQNKKIDFLFRLAGGEIEGEAVLDMKTAPGRYQVTADLSRIRLERIDAIKANEHLAVSGVLDGKAVYEGTPSTTKRTDGSFTVSEFRIALQTAFFGLDELDVGQAKASVSGNGRVLRVKSLTFGGPMAEGKITGTIELQTPLGQSLLNLSGNAKPRPELFARLQDTIPKGLVDPRRLGTRGLNFRVRGSIDSPDVSMR